MSRSGSCSVTVSTHVSGVSHQISALGVPAVLTLDCGDLARSENQNTIALAASETLHAIFPSCTWLVQTVWLPDYNRWLKLRPGGVREVVSGAVRRSDQLKIRLGVTMSLD